MITRTDSTSVWSNRLLAYFLDLQPQRCTVRVFLHVFAFISASALALGCVSSFFLSLMYFLFFLLLLPLALLLLPFFLSHALPAFSFPL